MLMKTVLGLFLSLAIASSGNTVELSNIPHEDRIQIKCLADNAYFEAGNQSLAGKIAVSHVVLNRTKTGKFPTTACSVINERNGRTCQFAWTCSPIKNRKKNAIQYKESVLAAHKAYYNIVVDNTKGALYFNTPRRTTYKNVTVRIEDHIFYKG